MMLNAVCCFISHSLLSSLPPTISKDTKFSHALQERLTTQIESEIAESLKRTYADLDLKSKLAKLDEICKKAKEEREGAEGKENSGGNVEKKRAWYETINSFIMCHNVFCCYLSSVKPAKLVLGDHPEAPQMIKLRTT